MVSSPIRGNMDQEMPWWDLETKTNSWHLMMFLFNAHALKAMVPAFKNTPLLFQILAF